MAAKEKSLDEMTISELSHEIRTLEEQDAQLSLELESYEEQLADLESKIQLLSNL